MKATAVSKADAAKQRGNEHFALKEYENALVEYSNAIALNSDDHTYYSNRSACLFRLGRYEEAVSDGRKCIDLRPEWVKGYWRTGYALLKLGQFEAAQETLKQGMHSTSS